MKDIIINNNKNCIFIFYFFNLYSNSTGGSIYLNNLNLTIKKKNSFFNSFSNNTGGEIFSNVLKIFLNEICFFNCSAPQSSVSYLSSINDLNDIKLI